MKRVLALVLSLLFVLTLLPATAMAATYSKITVTRNANYLLVGAAFSTTAITVKKHTSDSDAGTVVSAGGVDGYTYTLTVDDAPFDSSTPFAAADAGKTVKVKVDYQYTEGTTTKTLTDYESFTLAKAFPTGIALSPNPDGATLYAGSTLGAYLAAATVTVTMSGAPNASVFPTDTHLTFSPALDYVFTAADLAVGSKVYSVTYTDTTSSPIETTYTKQFTVNLSRTPVSSVTYTPSSPITLRVGNSIPLVPTFEPAGATDGITWAVTSGEAYINKSTFVNSGVLVGVSPGTATVTATLKKDSAVNSPATFTVNVINPPSSTVDVADLTVSQPTKKVFINGEHFDPAGMVVKYLLANESAPAGTPIAPADYDYKVSLTSTATTWYAGDSAATPVFNGTGTATITVRYRYYDSGNNLVTKTKTATVLVADAIPLKVEIVTQPKMTTYYLGEKLDTTGLTVRVAYTKDGLTVSGYGAQTLADCYIVGLTDKMDVVGERIYKIRYENQYGEAAPADLKVTVAESVNSIKLYDPSDPLTELSSLEFDYADIAAVKTDTFKVTLNPVNSPASSVAWSNSNPKVASYVYNETNGIVTVTPLAPGTTSISIRARGTTDVIATCVVTVKGDPAADVLDMKLNVNSYTMLVGSTYALIPVFTPSTASGIVTWSIVTAPDPGVIDSAKFLSSGILVGLKAGTIQVQASTPNPKGGVFTATCDITVEEIAVDSVTLSDTSVTLYAGSYYSILGTVLPADATDKTIAWTSSDDSNPPVISNTPLTKGAIVTVAAVDASSGKVMTNRENFLKYCAINNVTQYTATVTAVVSGGKTAKCTITVIKGTLLTDLSLDKHSLSLTLNQTAKLTPTLTPTTASNQELEWTSSKPAVATVDSSGNIKAVGAGSTVIRAQATDGSGKYDECVVQVSAVLIQSITVTPYISTINEEATLDLVANLYPANVSSTKVTWSSLNESIAKVDANGKVTGTGGGVTVIRATSADGSNVYGSAVVVVNGKIPVRSVSLPIGSFELLFGDSTVLATSFSPTNATNTATTWTTSDSSVVVVDSAGKVTGIKLGSANVTATAGGKSATITITVVSTLSKNGKVVNCKKRVNVRSQPSGASKQVGYANLGARYRILGQVGNWYKIQYSSSKEGYIWASYLELSTVTASYVSAGASTPTDGGTTTTPTKVTITNCNSYVNVRKGAGTSTEKIGTAALNSVYPYLATDGDWIKVTYNNDVAYIHKDFCLLS